MKIVLIIIAIITVSCGQKPPVGMIFGKAVVAPEFKPYLSKFLEDGKTYGKTFNVSRMSIVFNNSLNGTNILGQCSNDFAHPENGGKVEINRSFWNAATVDASDRENLIYHELGHCLLLRDHDDKTVFTTDGFNIYRSLMASSYSNGGNFINNYTTFITELYTKKIGTYHLLTVFGPNNSIVTDFPFSYYANTMALTSLEENPETYSLIANNLNHFDDMYKDMSKFGCNH
jgi:hypothetical protein